MERRDSERRGESFDECLRIIQNFTIPFPLVFDKVTISSDYGECLLTSLSVSTCRTNKKNPEEEAKLLDREIERFYDCKCLDCDQFHISHLSF